MTLQEAEELRLFLIDELLKYGFSPIVEQANKRLLEKFDKDKDPGDDQNDPNQVQLLTDFLFETIQVFRDFSNKNYQELITKINKNLDGEKIDAIVVELTGKSNVFNLSELPNYYEISNMLGAVREDILKGN